MSDSFVFDETMGRFNVLDLVSVALPPEFHWVQEEIEDESACGANFYAFDSRDRETLLAFVTVADASKDPTEPDVSALTDHDEQAVVDSLKRDISGLLAKDGREVVEWGPCRLWPMDMLSGLLVCYDTEGDGHLLRNISYRASVKGRKVVLIGGYPVPLHDVLSDPIYGVIAGATLLSGGSALAPLSRVSSDDPPRKVLADHFQSVGELPIAGGWGYSAEDACVIVKDDPAALPGLEFDGRRVQSVFVEKRIYEEMIVSRPEGHKFSGIGWNLIRQEGYRGEGRTFDKLTFEVTAFPDKDWEELKTEWEGPNGYESPNFNLAAHQRKRAERKLRLVREFWFDITSCETISLFGITFPWALRGLVRGGSTNYELTHPGLGYSVPYSGDDITVTVYIYDGGVPDIPADLNDQVVEDHFRSALGEVMQSKLYQKVEHGEAYGVGRDDKGVEFLCGEFFVVDNEGVNKDSYLYFATFNGKFVKLRVSLPSREDSSAIAELLWPEVPTGVLN